MQSRGDFDIKYVICTITHTHTHTHTHAFIQRHTDPHHTTHLHTHAHTHGPFVGIYAEHLWNP